MLDKSENKGKQIGIKIHKYQDEIRQFCMTYRRIHLYGVGYATNMMEEYLKEEGIIISDVIVGKNYRNTDFYKEKYKVYEIDEVNFNEEDGIILCVRVELQKEIRDDLKVYGLKNQQIYGQKIYLNYVFPELMNYSYIKKPEYTEEGYFDEYIELDDLGKQNGTDKSSLYHNYLNKYEFFLKKWKQKEIILLELGVYKGASLEMWKNYFQKATIYGVDWNSDCAKYKSKLSSSFEQAVSHEHKHESKNCNVIIGDLGSESFLDEIGKLSPNIIIDDASHLWSHQIKAICYLLPKIKSAGVFIMEDLTTSFSTFRYMGYDDATISTYEFCSALSEIVCSGEYLQNNNLTMNLLPLKKEIEELAMQIEMISFIQGSCIIVKK